MRPRKRPTDIFTKIPATTYYTTALGACLHGYSEQILGDDSLSELYGKVNLIFTSPPFPLNRKKRYGNLSGEDYLTWLVGFGPLLKRLLAKDGSIVLEVGNSWEPGKPVFSTLALRALLEFAERNKLHLCQEIICHNPSRLPGPASWVTINRIRLKDSYTRIWWMSATPYPKANNRNVLQPYSQAMKKLLATKKFNFGVRPSDHIIRKQAFSNDNGGSISPSVLSFSNTRSSDTYYDFCRKQGIRPHPARMQPELADFFIRFLTDPGDIVLDPFGGSNTTGSVAENLNRHWITIEAKEEYIQGSIGRFPVELLHKYHKDSESI